MMSPFEQAVSTSRYLMTFFWFFKFSHLIFWCTLKIVFWKNFYRIFSLLLVWIQLLNCSPSRVSFGFKYSALLRLPLFLSVHTLLLTCTRFFASQLTDSCWWCAWFDHLNFQSVNSCGVNLWKVFRWMKDSFINFEIKRSMSLRNAVHLDFHVSIFLN